MSLNDGERQVAPTVSGIRRDHVARYEWAAQRIEGDTVLDLACGIGYGARILADAGYRVTAIDRDREAIQYGHRHYAHSRIAFACKDVTSVYQLERCDTAVCFETVEHIVEPLPLLKMLAAAASRLLVSVPNEDVMPYGDGYAFHHRHYTPAQFEDLLRRAGWRVVEWWGQAGPQSEVERNMMGRTIIAVCERHENAAQQAPAESSLRGKHVSIVGLGPSSAAYVDTVKRLGGRHQYCDETWVINAFGDVLACDRVFHMDDVRVQEIRAEAEPHSNIAAMLRWLKTHPGPVITSRTNPDYPGLVAFPLEDVVNEFPQGYFNSTAAYAVAYAIHLGAGKISMWGCDFTYPNAHDAEKGRACVEYWLGMAAARGIQLVAPKTTTLLDAINTQAERFYGYDCVDLSIKREGDRIVVGYSEKAQLPTAAEIEAGYDHSAHPNRLVRDAAN